MKPVRLKKYILPNLPYVGIALFATKFGQAMRIAPGTDFSGKVLHMIDGMHAAFSSAAPSFHPLVPHGKRQIVHRTDGQAAHGGEAVRQMLHGEQDLILHAGALPAAARPSARADRAARWLQSGYR